MIALLADMDLPSFSGQLTELGAAAAKRTVDHFFAVAIHNQLSLAVRRDGHMYLAARVGFGADFHRLLAIIRFTAV